VTVGAHPSSEPKTPAAVKRGRWVHLPTGMEVAEGSLSVTRNNAPHLAELGAPRPSRHDM
jgi:hypothetical protein